MDQKFYVTRTNKRTGQVFYKRYKCADGFTAARYKEVCWKFSKRGAQKIAAFLNERNAWPSLYEYGIEAVTGE